MALFYGVLVATPIFSIRIAALYRAARIIFNLPKDMATHDALKRAERPTIRFYYKLAAF